MLTKAARYWEQGLQRAMGAGWVAGAHQGARGEGGEAGHGPGEKSPHCPCSSAAQPSAEPSPHQRSGPGFNHPSITRCLLLLTAHLLALVKRSVNSERNSPTLPEQRNGQEGASPPSQPRTRRRLVPSTGASAARKGWGAGSVHACWHRQQPGREGPGKVLRIHHLPGETKGVPVLDSHSPKSAPPSVRNYLA